MDSSCCSKKYQQTFLIGLDWGKCLVRFDDNAKTFHYQPIFPFVQAINSNGDLPEGSFQISDVRKLTIKLFNKLVVHTKDQIQYRLLLSNKHDVKLFTKKFIDGRAYCRTKVWFKLQQTLTIYQKEDLKKYQSSELCRFNLELEVARRCKLISEHDQKANNAKLMKLLDISDDDDELEYFTERIYNKSKSKLVNC